MHELLYAAVPAAGGAAFAAKVWWRQRLGARLDLGTLPGADGRRHSLADFPEARAFVVLFMSNKCPGVKAYDGRLRRLHAKWRGRVAFLGVNSANTAFHPDEGLEGMARAAQERDLPFPYLKDGDQSVARAFGAVCTPEVFVLDHRRRLRYQGRIDDAIVESGARRRFLEDALEAIVGPRRHFRRLPPATVPLGCTLDYA